jgi:hypothetical protein
VRRLHVQQIFSTVAASFLRRSAHLPQPPQWKRNKRFVVGPQPSRDPGGSSVALVHDGRDKNPCANIGMASTEIVDLTKEDVVDLTNDDEGEEQELSAEIGKAKKRAQSLLSMNVPSTRAQQRGAGGASKETIFLLHDGSHYDGYAPMDWRHILQLEILYVRQPDGKCRQMNEIESETIKDFCSSQKQYFFAHWVHRSVPKERAEVVTDAIVKTRIESMLTMRTPDAHGGLTCNETEWHNVVPETCGLAIHNFVVVNGKMFFPLGVQKKNRLETHGILRVDRNSACFVSEDGTCHEITTVDSEQSDTDVRLTLTTIDLPEDLKPLKSLFHSTNRSRKAEISVGDYTLPRDTQQNALNLFKKCKNGEDNHDVRVKYLRTELLNLWCLCIRRLEIRKLRAHSNNDTEKHNACAKAIKWYLDFGGRVTPINKSHLSSTEWANIDVYRLTVELLDIQILIIGNINGSRSVTYAYKDEKGRSDVKMDAAYNLFRSRTNENVLANVVCPNVHEFTCERALKKIPRPSAWNWAHFEKVTAAPDGLCFYHSVVHLAGRQVSMPQFPFATRPAFLSTRLQEASVRVLQMPCLRVAKPHEEERGRHEYVYRSSTPHGAVALLRAAALSRI